MESPRRQRILLVDFNAFERRALRESLLNAGFEVSIALEHAELCLKLLTWHPDAVVADGDFHVADMAALANAIRTSARVPVPVLFVCKHQPPPEVQAKVLLKPVAFAALLASLRTTLADRDDSEPAGGWVAPTAR